MGAGTSSVTQPSGQWLDLPDHEDTVFFLDVKEITGTVTLTYETSPTCEDRLFVPTIPAFALSTGLQIDRAIFATCGFPLCRFLRWKLAGSGAPTGWDCTFRILVAAYTFGREDDAFTR